MAGSDRDIAPAFIGFVLMSNFIVTDDQIAEYKQTVEELRQQAEQTQVTCLSSTKIQSDILSRQGACVLILYNLMEQIIDYVHVVHQTCKRNTWYTNSVIDHAT